MEEEEEEEAVMKGEEEEEEEAVMEGEEEEEAVMRGRRRYNREGSVHVVEKRADLTAFTLLYCR